MTLSPGFDALLRIVGALAYIFGGTALFASLVPGVHPTVYVVVGFTLMFSSVLLFNRDPWARIRGLSLRDHLAELERKGRVERETIRSARTIHFEDSRTGCAAYLVECADQRVLCLYGQYFGEWRPIVDEEDEEDRPRAFPTTEFDLVRRLPRREVMDLTLRGRVYEPDIVDPDPKLLTRLQLRLEDGAYMEGVHYDALLRQLMEVTVGTKPPR